MSIAWNTVFANGNPASSLRLLPGANLPLSNRNIFGGGLS
jgi:hypothetical protein